MIAYFLIKDIHGLKIFLLAMREIKNNSKEKQICILAKILNDYKIDANKL